MLKFIISVRKQNQTTYGDCVQCKVLIIITVTKKCLFQCIIGIILIKF